MQENNTASGQTLVERVLSTAERDLQLMIDSIPALAWSALPDRTVEFFNRHYLNYVGLSREEMRNWQWKSVIHPDDMHVVDAAWRDFSVARKGERSKPASSAMTENTVGSLFGPTRPSTNPARY